MLGSDLPYLNTATWLSIPGSSSLVCVSTAPHEASDDEAGHNEYYMSGSHDVLIKFSSKMLDGDDTRQCQYMELLTFILTNQFIQLPGKEARTWRTPSGSGMGMPCSGEVADATFYWLVEHELLPEGLLSRFGVVGYYRFKDDFIVFFDDVADPLWLPGHVHAESKACFQA